MGHLNTAVKIVKLERQIADLEARLEGARPSQAGSLKAPIARSQPTSIAGPAMTVCSWLNEHCGSYVVAEYEESLTDRKAAGG